MPNKCIIEKIRAREVFDSRGVLTIEVDVFTDRGWGRNAAPFGAPGSRGEFEASAYGSVGIDGAAQVVARDLVPRLVGVDAAKLSQCDSMIKEVDGTANYSRIGGNVASALSIAIARAASDSLKVELFQFLAPKRNSFSLPVPLGNIIGGGAHSAGPTPDMQEHLALPVNAKSLKEAVQWNILLHEETGNLLEKRDRNFTGGSDDERAWAVDLDDTQCLEVLSEACEIMRRKAGAKYRLGLDLAADRLWDPRKQKYQYVREGKSRNTEEQIDFVENLVEKFDLYYVEDAFNSNDYRTFSELRKRVGGHCLVCGDDLLATNKKRIAEGLKLGSCNSMIIKVNQIGTLTDARDTNDYAQQHGIKTIVSHRSGETDDNTVAHIGVGWGCTMIKTGVLGGERLAKLNELIRIEEGLGEKSTLAKLDLDI
ncbi:MAG TPA: enolase C-terminal domain-like protein [Dehalococcoidales bacterium]